MLVPTKTEIDRAFAWWLREYIDNNYLSQYQAAVNTGLYPDVINRILKGKKTRLKIR